MSKVLLSFLFLWASLSFCQDYDHVDRKVRHYPHFKSLDVLSIRIQNDFERDEDRVRAAFVWVARNIEYMKSLDNVFQPTQQIIHYSEFGKRKQIQRLLRKKMLKAFKFREGVCLEYSLLLDALCSKFGLRSEVIVGVAKTEIKHVEDEQQYKNHTWNAVNIDGEWQLMDPTWASVLLVMHGRWQGAKYLDYYFLSPPGAFIKHHLPANPDWQLLKDPVDAKSFFLGPIYLPEYFGTGIALSPKTQGIIPLSSRNEHLLYFDALPEKRALYYTVGSSSFKRMELQKHGTTQYFSKIKLSKRSRAKEEVTVYWERSPILNFKIERASDGLR